MNKDQKLLAEAYTSILTQEAGEPSWHTEEFFKVLAGLEPGMIYSYKGSDMAPEYNHWIFTTKDGLKNAGIRRLGTQGTRVLTDYQGKQQTSLDRVLDLVPSEMSPEEFKARDSKSQEYITKSVQSQKYSD